MEAGLPQARQVPAVLLLSSHLQTTVTSMMQGRTMVSKVSYVSRTDLGLTHKSRFLQNLTFFE